MKRMLCGVLLVLGFGCTKDTAPVPIATPSPAPPPNQAPPPVVGTFAARGVVTESGGGAAIAGVLVETSSGRSTVTDGNGFYEFSNLPRMKIAFSKPGFEPRGPYGFYQMDRDTTINVVTQRSLWLAAGQALSSTLFRDDVAFPVLSDALDDDNPFCGPPCKLVRISVPASGHLTAHVTSAPSIVDLYSWVAQQERLGSRDLVGVHGASGDVVASLRVMAGVDVLVFVGTSPPAPTADVPFRLATSWEP